MRIRSVRMCQDPACDGAAPHEDDEGTRVLGVPAWMICLAVIVALPVGMLAYTASVR